MTAPTDDGLRASARGRAALDDDWLDEAREHHVNGSGAYCDSRDMARLINEVDRLRAALSAAPAPRGETQVTIGARMARAIAQWREGPDTEGKHADADLDDAGEIEEYMRRNGLRVSLIEPSIENCPTCGADDDAESDTCPDGWHWHTPAPAWPSAESSPTVAVCGNCEHALTDGHGELRRRYCSSCPECAPVRMQQLVAALDSGRVEQIARWYHAAYCAPAWWERLEHRDVDRVIVAELLEKALA